MVERDVAIETAERVSSVFSVLGAILIITTFLYDTRFRKPINRLVFYASWGNLFANVATLISREGIKRGVDAPLCQFQGFLIQWFMPADALFTFAMACDVYLTFFKQYDSVSLRKLEWRYLSLCYGLPFIPALTFLCIDTAQRGKVYGSANLWCWISRDYNGLRIGAFYGPVWIIILFDVFIYIKVGMVVFRWRKSLVSLGMRTATSTSGTEPAAKERPTYEVKVVSQVPHSRTHSFGYRPPSLHSNLPLSPGRTRTNSLDQRLSDQSTQVNTTISYQPGTGKALPKAVDANRATLQYCYTACLFLCALIVTWVPSTINRLYTLINHSSADSPFALDLASALVLPLQGFWNTVIYVVTSWSACRALWQEFMPSCGCFSTRRPAPNTPGHKLRHLGSTDLRAPLSATPLTKDPYPLSPIAGSHWLSTDKYNNYSYRHGHNQSLSTDYAYSQHDHPYPSPDDQPSSPSSKPMNFLGAPSIAHSRPSLTASDNHDERADTIASLNYPSARVTTRHVRGQFSWGTNWGTPTTSEAERSSALLRGEQVDESSSPQVPPRSQSAATLRREDSKKSLRSRAGSRSGERSGSAGPGSGGRSGSVGHIGRSGSFGSVGGGGGGGGLVRMGSHRRDGSGHIVEQMRGATPDLR